MAKRLNILVIPDEGGQTKKYLLSVIWLKILVIFATVVFVGIVVMSVSWSKLMVIALNYEDLERENTRLELENQRVVRIAREVDQNRILPINYSKLK